MFILHLASILITYLPQIHPLQYLYQKRVHKHNGSEMYMKDWSYNYFLSDLPLVTKNAN